ncbi:MAG: PTS sugar transporter subunit IIA [Pseudomonadota bacterium]|jgi:PTS system mannose-specific IIA component|nr:PTS fructose transporter subunit IIA [Rhodospirillaceae bacterium]MEE2995769.1 PTS sugar transporter subunit IIA [Pseudomonadota bacterium]|tara:strand:- start:234 stop:641 length:408 start_codon:yes stop_codon:yes gene_type:complete
MIGLVIVTHGRLAEEFISALEHIVGPQKRVESVCIGPKDKMENRRSDILAAVDRAEGGAGVIVLTDMFGGTPSNLAISILKEANVEVLAGVNLPLLVKLATVRKSADLEQAVTEAYVAGRKYIKRASELLDHPGN